MKKRIPVLLAALAGVVAPIGAFVASPADAATCSNPAWRTSNHNGMWNNGGYVVHNNMWNVSGYKVSETMYGCSYRNWYVHATANNSSGDGAVKTYPNVHKDFHNWNTGKEPRLSSFKTIRSTFAARTPHVGIYDTAYDIWLNGVPGKNEVMVWTDNYRQVPSGSVIAKGLSFGGHTWKVYATHDNSYIAFVPSKRLTSGTLHLRSMLGWLASHGRVSSSSTLGQICYGFEIVSTGGNRATFKVDNFSVTTAKR
jgi:hypothetical protein